MNPSASTTHPHPSTPVPFPPYVFYWCAIPSVTCESGQSSVSDISFQILYLFNRYFLGLHQGCMCYDAQHHPANETTFPQCIWPSLNWSIQLQRKVKNPLHVWLSLIPLFPVPSSPSTKHSHYSLAHYSIHGISVWAIVHQGFAGKHIGQQDSLSKILRRLGQGGTSPFFQYNIGLPCWHGYVFSSRWQIMLIGGLQCTKGMLRRKSSCPLTCHHLHPC